MNIKSISIQNFMPIKSLQLDFDKGIYLIIGENGSGKTSVFEAIAFCYYGHSRAGTNQELIHDGSKAMQVEVVFTFEGHEYKVTRSLQSGKSAKLSIFQDDADISESTTPKTQDIINNLLKMDSQMFLTTVYFEQENSRSFVDATPAERKEALRRILSLSEYERYLAEAKKRLSERQNKMADLLSKLELLESQSEVSVESIDDLESNLETSQKKLNNLKKELEAAIKQESESEKIELLKEQLEDIKNDLLKTQTKLAELVRKQEFDTKDMEAKRKRRDELNSKLEDKAEVDAIEEILKKLSNDIKKQSELQAVCRSRIKQIDKSLYELGDSATCPTCLTVLSEAKRKSLKKEFNTEQQEQSEKADALDAKIKELKEKELKELKRCKEMQAAFNTLSGELAGIKAAIPALKEKIEQYDSQKQELHDKVKSLREKISTLEEKLGKMNMAQMADIRSVRSNINQQELEIKSIQAQIVKHQESKRREKERKEQIDELQRIKKIGDRKIARSQRLVQAFGKDGIPLLLTQNILGFVQDESTKLLRQLSTDLYRVEFESEGSNLDIWVDSSRGRMKYRMFSGGQKTRINFAIRVALSNLLSQRAGSKIELLFIDEGFGALDEDGIDAFSEILPKLLTHFSQIFPITHVTKMKNMDYNIIEVSKNEAGETMCQTQ